MEKKMRERGRNGMQVGQVRERKKDEGERKREGEGRKG